MNLHDIPWCSKIKSIAYCESNLKIKYNVNNNNTKTRLDNLYDDVKYYISNKLNINHKRVEIDYIMAGDDQLIIKIGHLGCNNYSIYEMIVISLK